MGGTHFLPALEPDRIYVRVGTLESPTQCSHEMCMCQHATVGRIAVIESTTVTQLRACVFGLGALTGE
jgi:hypothetical protein